MLIYIVVGCMKNDYDCPEEQFCTVKAFKSLEAAEHYGGNLTSKPSCGWDRPFDSYLIEPVKLEG
jgi:hypothetical protein